MESEQDSQEATVLCREVVEAFAPHSIRSQQQRNETISAWEVFPDAHDDELVIDYTSHKPYCALSVLRQRMPSRKSQSMESIGRPFSAHASSKPRKKSISSSTSNVSIRKSRSSRCVSARHSSTTTLSPFRDIPGGSSTAPPSGRAACPSKRHLHGSVMNPSPRSVAKFPMLYHGMKDITYQFAHYQHHQQHMEHYRKSYTYHLMRNYKDLRMNGVGANLQSTFRLNLCGPSDSKQFTKGVLRGWFYARDRSLRNPTSCTSTLRAPVTPPCAALYSEPSCTSAVPYKGSNSEPKLIHSRPASRSAPASATTSGGSKALAKSTMDIASVVVKNSHHRPFVEKDPGFKLVKGPTFETLLRSPRKERPAPNSTPQVCCQTFRRGHKSLLKYPKAGRPPGRGPVRKNRSNTTPPLPVSMMIGSWKTPLGKVPVAIRRSSPSIRGKRDPNGSTIDGAKYLSIAMGTQTVTSPYCRAKENSNEDPFSVI